MRRFGLLALLAAGLWACGDTGTSDGRSGDGSRSGNGGTGGTPPPENVDATCRDWCANEPVGPSCHEGSFESVQPCYDDCLQDYEGYAQQTCGDEWVAIKDCQLELQCADLFGDCDPAEDVLSECLQLADAESYCTSRCPSLDRQECISQYLSTGACAEPFSASLVYCDNPAAAEPSCSLAGYSMADDSALRAKLEGCAMSGCHGTAGVPSNSWTLDLSGSVQGALSALNTFADNSPYFLVDDLDPDCSQMLSEMTSKPVGEVRMPVTGGYWNSDEIDCFRSYLHAMYPQ